MFRRAISGTGRFDRTIFRYCRYLRKSRDDFFTRPQPTDSRRSYYDPRPFGTQADRIQGVRESHRLLPQNIFCRPFDNRWTLYNDISSFSNFIENARVFRFNISTKKKFFFEDIIKNFIFGRWFLGHYEFLGHYDFLFRWRFVFSYFWSNNKSERLLERAHT